MQNAKMVVVTKGIANYYSLQFVRVWIEWALHTSVPPMPVAVNWGKLGGDRDLITLSDVTFRRGIYSLTVPRGYEFDGASIPRMFRWLRGYERIGRHIWAALAHDYMCDHPELLPRVIADAIFITLLLDTGVDESQSHRMYRAVRLWSTYRAWMAGPEESLPITKAIASADAGSPVAKAEAVSDALDSALASTILEIDLTRPPS